MRNSFFATVLILFSHAPAFAQATLSNYTVTVVSQTEATVSNQGVKLLTLKCGSNLLSNVGPFDFTCPNGINGATAFHVMMSYDGSQGQWGSDAGNPGQLVIQGQPAIELGCSAARQIPSVLPEFPFDCTFP